MSVEYLQRVWHANRYILYAYSSSHLTFSHLWLLYFFLNILILASKPNRDSTTYPCVYYFNVKVVTGRGTTILVYWNILKCNGTFTIITASLFLFCIGNKIWIEVGDIQVQIFKILFWIKFIVNKIPCIICRTLYSIYVYTLHNIKRKGNTCIYNQ